MRPIYKTMRRSVSVACFLFLSVLSYAGRPDRAAFFSTKEEIQRLSLERIRSAGSDYGRVLVTAENRLRTLHENFRVAGGTPPTHLDGDLSDIRGSCLKMLRLVTAGRQYAPDPVARKKKKKKWALYRAEIDGLLRGISEKKSEGVPESRIYWETLHTFKDLKDQTSESLLFNIPPGEPGLEEAMGHDEAALLEACETTPKKTRGQNVRVVTPHEFESPGKPDIQAFYRSLDLIPDARPLRTGSLTVPPGSRTVTMREDKSHMVFRPKKGNGIAYLGQTEAELRYDYVAVPPDTPYYFENTGAGPLVLEYVGLKP